MDSFYSRHLEAFYLGLFLLIFSAVSIPNGYRLLMDIGLLVSMPALAWAPVRASLRERALLVGLCLLATLYWWWQREASAPVYINSFRLYLPLAALPLLVWTWRHPLPSLRPMVLAACIAAPVALGEAAYQFLHLNRRAEGGDFFYIHFGDLSALFALLLWVAGLRMPASRRLQLLAWTSALAFAGASVLSMTRGAWLLLLLVPAVMLRGGYRPSLKMLAGMAALIGALTVLSPSGITHKVYERIAAAQHEVTLYETREVASTSVGARLQMWQFAWELFCEKPWLGWNQQGYEAQRDIAVRQKRVDPMMEQFHHPHNEFLNEAAKSGVVGIVFLLLVYGMPLAYFARQWRRSAPDSLSRTLALLGMLIPLAYGIFGLTEAILFWNNGPIALYFFLIAVLATRSTAAAGHDDAAVQAGRGACPCTPSTLPATHTSASTGTTSSEAQRKNVV
ncbi:O-antigen ligase family protein [Brachymonas sp. M4Q-1]|uniref:O-antigen ligase family protein n=1 Tax=Brachymonas sp. M4Q-1 TaxID=3416906 RepID=UPI003CEB3E22